MKYRILRSNKGTYKVQYKFMFMWLTYQTGLGDMFHDHEMYTLESAQEFLREIRSIEEPTTWTVVEDKL